MSGLSQQRTLILGIGNILLSDEGAGVRAMEHLHSLEPSFPNTEFLDGGTLSFTLAADIEAATHLIVFDAAQFCETPGTVHCMTGTQMDEFLARGGRSVHEVGLMDLMDISRLAERLPSQRALVGIQPSHIGWGEQLSPSVEMAIPEASKCAMDLLQLWHSKSATA